MHLLDGVKSSDDEEKMPELLFSAKRVVYRFAPKPIYKKSNAHLIQ